MKIIKGGLAVVFDEMSWPGINDPLEVEWKLRHAQDQLTPGEMCHAASVMAAYRALVLKPLFSRNLIVKRLREAARAAGEG